MTEEQVSEEIEATKTAVAQPVEPSDDSKKNSEYSFWTEKRLEMVVAILLGITTLLSAWASWIGSLHSGIQAIHFTESNNVYSKGTAEYNGSTQMYLADFMAWNAIKDYYYDLEFAKIDGNQAKIDLLESKIEVFKQQGCSDTLREGIEWMEKNGKINPFEMPGLEEKYYQTAQQTLDRSQELFKEGQRDNTKGDSYNLVSVIYSLVLFLLGIVGIFKNLPNRLMVVLIAAFGMVFATIYMCTIPLPTGFNPLSFFAINLSL